jgi:hypothetical protein
MKLLTRFRILLRRLRNWWRIPTMEKVNLVREHYLDEWRGGWR